MMAGGMVMSIAFYRLSKTDILEFTSVVESTGGRWAIASWSSLDPRLVAYCSIYAFDL